MISRRPRARTVVCVAILCLSGVASACSPQQVMAYLGDRGHHVTAEQATMLALRSGAQDPQGAREVGRSLVAARGWSPAQFDCLNTLWGARESGWRWWADNPTSSAYGIPQALPGSKMSSHGRDWRTNGYVQIAWGLDYIAGRYGTPCSALSARKAKGWY